MPGFEEDSYGVLCCLMCDSGQVSGGDAERVAVRGVDRLPAGRVRVPHVLAVPEGDHEVPAVDQLGNGQVDSGAGYGPLT